MHRAPRWTQLQSRTLLKVCCISTPAEAHLALSVGADVLGLVSAMPSGPGVVDDATIATIVSALPASAEAFLLTSRTDTAGLVDQVHSSGVSALQLVDAVPFTVLDEVRAAVPGVHLVQVVHVIDETSVTEATAALPHVDALLLDSGNPRLAIKELGGTGRVHDWRLSRQISDAAREASKPLFLAGGLRRDNLVSAVTSVRPTGLDVCSGVRSDGRLDAEKLTAFVHELRRADGGLTTDRPASQS